MPRRPLPALALSLLSTLLLAAACASSSDRPEGDAGTDAGRRDAGNEDAAATRDAGPGADAATESDSSVEIDADNPSDAAVEHDAGEIPLGDGELVLEPTPGASVAAIFEQGEDTLDRIRQPGVGVDYDTCVTVPVFPLATHYALIEVKNPGDLALKVDLNLDTAPDGEWAYVYLASYADKPESAAELANCLTGANDRCPSSQGLQDERWPCLRGEGAPTIPAQGSIWAYVPQHSPPSQPSGGRVRFVLRATVSETAQ